MYTNYMCQLCNIEVDSQEHALKCHVIKESLSQQEKQLLNNVHYEDIFGALNSQLKISQLFQSIIRIKKRILSTRVPTSAYPGINSGP